MTRPAVFLAATAALLLSAIVDAQEPIKLAPGEEQKTMRFSRFRTELRDGDPIGEIRTGTFCGGRTALTMNARTEQAVIGPVTRVLREEFTRAGYRDPVRVQQKLFEEDTEQGAPELLLGGLLQEFHADYCSNSAGARTDGRVRVKVRWEVYDSVSRRVIHTKVTEGSFKTDGEAAMREGEFFSMAYRDAVKRLLADQEFHAALVLAPAVAVAPKPAEQSGGLVLQVVNPIPDALTSNMTLTRAAVVTVKQASGSGSGFFVSENGHVLTNSHVVGANRFVRVVLATGRELVGEVVQQDAARDVALIKTEGSNFVALAVNPDELNVGAEVTAIGSPLGETLSGTVTRGIVSGYRTIKGKRYIQSDTTVLPGSSGGPLLDRSGRVVGIAVAALGTTRINFFVPIQDAMTSLGITFANR